MEDGSIDLVVTSPPYDNLRDYNGYHFPFQDIARELYRVMKKGGVVVWVVGDQTVNGSETGTSFRQALYFMEVGFNLHDTMIWNKKSCRYPETNRYYPVFEYMFVFSVGAPITTNLIIDRRNIYSGSKVARKSQMRTKCGKMKENSAYRKDRNRKVKDIGVRFNIWNINVSASGDDKIAMKHPGTFSEQLVFDHIKSWSNANDIVYDTFMGSGTTAKMAIILQRKYIGSEISEKYCQLAEKRIQNEKKQERFDLAV